MHRKLDYYLILFPIILSLFLYILGTFPWYIAYLVIRKLTYENRFSKQVLISSYSFNKLGNSIKSLINTYRPFEKRMNAKRINDEKAK